MLSGRWTVWAGAAGAALCGLACSASHRAKVLPADASVAPSVTATSDASSAHLDSGNGVVRGCAQDDQCTLVAKGCCSCGAQTLRPVLVADEAAEQAACATATCRECRPDEHDPLAPWLAPACVAGRCVARDLRLEDETSCTSDDECELSRPQLACCGSCSGDPRAWRALRVGASVHLAGHGCAGDVACAPCAPSAQPTAFCAQDGHCAVRATPAVAGSPDPDCFAPGARAQLALHPAARGCDCFEGDLDVCDSVAEALFCIDGHWETGFNDCWMIN